jgi:hypothetical protein
LQRLLRPADAVRAEPHDVHEASHRQRDEQRSRLREVDPPGSHSERREQPDDEGPADRERKKAAREPSSGVVAEEKRHHGRLTARREQRGCGKREQESRAEADSAALSDDSRCEETGQAELQQHEQRSEQEKIGQPTPLRRLDVDCERSGPEQHELDGTRQAHGSIGPERPSAAGSTTQEVRSRGRGADESDDESERLARDLPSRALLSHEKRCARQSEKQDGGRRSEREMARQSSRHENTARESQSRCYEEQGRGGNDKPLGPLRKNRRRLCDRSPPVAANPHETLIHR